MRARAAAAALLFIVGACDSPTDSARTFEWCTQVISASEETGLLVVGSNELTPAGDRFYRTWLLTGQTEKLLQDFERVKQQGGGNVFSAYIDARVSLVGERPNPLTYPYLTVDRVAVVQRGEVRLGHRDDCVNTIDQRRF